MSPSQDRVSPQIMYVQFLPVAERKRRKISTGMRRGLQIKWTQSTLKAIPARSANTSSQNRAIVFWKDILKKLICKGRSAYNFTNGLPPKNLLKESLALVVSERGFLNGIATW